jgi:hypothetical protein
VAIEKTKQIIAAISQGAMLKEACREFDLSPVTFWTVTSGDSELGNQYEQARRSRADLDVDDMIRIADDVTLNPQQAKNAIDARKFRASKQYAQLYGDRIDVNVTGTVNIAETLSMARARLLPRASQDVLDAEVVETPTLEVKDAKVDDIFS